MSAAAQCFVSHLEGAIDRTRLEPHVLHTVHADRPILVRYDLDAVARAVSPADLCSRARSLWRYRELLPYRDADAVVELGETMTPVVRCPRLGAVVGVDDLIVKDESRLPTGSFKARGMAMAVTMARELGVTRVAVPTAGNAGGALAAYAARAGLACDIFMPADTPQVNRLEASLHGAHVHLVDGLIDECGRRVRDGSETHGWFDMSTLREPYRIEGKKTMGLELAEQLDWAFPDAIFYPTGGGTGLIGMWKAFEELASLGWLASPHAPRMYACQSDGCDPIVRAFEAGERFATRVEDARTEASGLRVPAALGDFLILDAVRASGGAALAAPEGRLRERMHMACAAEGLAICPETAACLLALETAVRDGRVRRDEQVVVFNTGAAQKYIEVMA